jgi:hypothetical protein
MGSYGKVASCYKKSVTKLHGSGWSCRPGRSSPQAWAAPERGEGSAIPVIPFSHDESGTEAEAQGKLWKNPEVPMIALTSVDGVRFVTGKMSRSRHFTRMPGGAAGPSPKSGELLPTFTWRERPGDRELFV